jgi:uncharacterized DUF497 family protein
VEIEFDPAKDAANIAKHGISLARAADLEVGRGPSMIVSKSEGSAPMA